MRPLLTKSKDLLTHKLTTILKNEKISPKSWNKVMILEKHYSKIDYKNNGTKLIVKLSSNSGFDNTYWKHICLNKMVVKHHFGKNINTLTH